MQKRGGGGGLLGLVLVLSAGMGLGSGCAEAELQGKKASGDSGLGGDGQLDGAAGSAGGGGVAGMAGAAGVAGVAGSTASGGSAGAGTGGQPGCIEYATMVQPIFDKSCTSCHSGAKPPVDLDLTSYAGVIKGGQTGNEVIACQSGSSLLYMKITMPNPPVGMQMPANGPPYLPQSEMDVIGMWIDQGARASCADPDPCSDSTPPVFGGLTGATVSSSKLGVDLCWSAATDDLTPQSALLYDVYAATTQGGQVFTGPASATSAPGATCINLEGLTPGQEYCYVVRARDGAGNRDANVVEKCVTIPQATCIEYATMVQPILDAECTSCHSGASPPQALKLGTYAEVLKGGATGSEVIACKSDASLIYQKISMANPPVGVQMPADGPPYLTAVQIDVFKKWIDQGARASCADPDPCSDTVPPTFGGLTSATVSASKLGVDLCWAAGSDNLTPAGSLVYDIYGATSPGGQVFTGPATKTSAAGATCLNIEGLTPGQQYCYVARARDGAGNRDTNVVEKCVTIPAASCIEYATMVQPIFDAECKSCHSGLAPPQALKLDTYANVLKGGATGSEVIACQSGASLLYQKISMANPPVGVQMPADGPPFLTAVQIDTIKKWIDEGARTSCAAPDPCTDTVPPTFAGLVSATVSPSKLGVDLCWAAGTDNVTPQASLVYDIFGATAPGGQVFSGPATKTSAAGATCVNIEGLTPGQQYCYVARARDGAGNRDANAVEKCVTIPAAACIEYASMVQPIFNTECISCHSGAGAPQGLVLDTYAGVMAGGLTGNEVIACQSPASLLYQKISLANPPVGAQMPADGPPFLTTAQIDIIKKWIDEGARTSCAAPNPCTDTTPPSFGGLTSASVSASKLGVDLCWAAGSDNVTPQASLLYDVFGATSPGGQVFSGPASKTSAPGATCMNIEGLTPGQQYCYVARARDGAGNRDANTVEKCVTIPAASCIEYATMVQPIFNAECTSCHSGLNPPQGLKLDTYAGVIAGGSTGNEVIACQSPASLLYQKISMANPPVGVQMPADGPPFLTSVQIDTIKKWIDEGARTSCAAPNPCTDTTPPAFGGLTSATVSASKLGVDLCWAAGSDNVTPQASLLYDVYGATSQGGQVFSGPATKTSASGATCLNIEGLTPGQQYCYVARARDGAGNRDANTVEKCVTIPAASCIEYATMVQPIFNAECTSCHSGASPPQGLKLDTYVNVLKGGATGSEVIACQSVASLLYQKISMANPPVGAQMPADGPPYLTPVQIDTIKKWIDQGARTSCAAPDPCTDTAPPTFAGLATATVSTSKLGVDLCWAPATDNVTPQASLLYDIFGATSPGGQNLTGPATKISTPGATCVNIEGLTPGQQYCYVARARDGAGNRDTNTVEKCVTIPAATCIEYATMVQPIFNAECTSCHSGASPPQGLKLDTYAGVIAGGATGSEVIACQGTASLLYQKISLANPPVGVQMPADGPPYLTSVQIDIIKKWIDEGARTSCAAPNPCTDTTPPSFGGLTTATVSASKLGVDLCWVAGTDNVTPQASLLYDVYGATSPGGQVFSGPATKTSTPGATCVNIEGLTPGQQYCYVARARDGAGNRDANTVEKCVTIPAASCIEYATMVQPIFNAECTSCHSGATPPQGLKLDTYAGVIAGGSTGNEVIACQGTASLLYQKISMATPPVGVRMPADGPPFLTIVQIDTIKKWIDEGARTSCAAPNPCTDTTPPSFGGLTSATVSATQLGVDLCWTAGTDNVTPQASLLYDVYGATSPGGQVFSGPATKTSTPGATCLNIEGLTPGQQYCYVARARDAAGNRDANTVEKCVTIPAASCIEYATMVQPIFNAECTSCHSGLSPPQGLKLDTYAGVIAGGATGNEVIACQGTASLLYQKISMATPPVGVQMPADGPPYLTAVQIDTIKKWIDQGARTSCAAPNPCTDTTPPTFGGLTSAAVSASQLGVDLCWTPGTDNVTPQANLLYDVYGATSPGGQVFSGPATKTSTPGATCLNIEGLTPGQQYCYVARARDAAGNRDANTVEKCVTIPAATCIDYATMVQPIFNAECTSCHSGGSPPQGLKLDSYAGVIAGGATGNEVVQCQSASSLLYQKISMATPPIGVRMPADGPPYLTSVQIDIIKKWIDEGARTSCAAPNPCNNTTPPTFGGLVSAVASNATTAKLCWNAATDDATPQASIVYDVYEATTSGGQSFTSPPTYSSAPGALCIDVDALSPQQQYCWVVRARDGAGNRDANTVQKCLTMPAVPPGCVDYATMVQPMFDKFCTHCHSNPMPPQWLRLDTYEGVMAGGARRNEVVACNPGASLLISKVSATPSVGKRMPYDGPPYLSATQISLLTQWVQNGAQRSCSVPAACSDAAAPTFAGVQSVTPLDTTTLRVCWNAATDAGTPAADIKYDLYEAATSGGQAFSQPPQTTVVGATCTDVKVGPGTNMCFVVRARDLRGNRDTNTKQLCAATSAASCAVEYDQMVQPIFAARCTFCHSGSSPGHYLGLKGYGDVLAGGSLRNEIKGCDWPNSLVNLKTSGAVCGARMPRDGPPWLAPSERSLLEAWVSSGARKSCSDPATCGDTVKPTFAGATSATALDATTVRVCWNPATDNATKAEGITYLVYEAATPGAQQLSSPASYAIAGGQTCIDIPSPVSSQSCYVVRARDLAWNTDTNTVQVCTTTPAGCFGYWQQVQPIFDARCVHCHGNSNPPKGINWSTFTTTMSTGSVKGCDPNAGKLLEMVDTCQMPRDTMAGGCNLATACLTPNQRRLLRQWIVNGADENCPWGNCN